MSKVAIALAVALVSLPVAAFAQPKSSDAASPREKVVLSYFHDVLDGRQIGLLDSLFLSDCVIYRPEGTVRGMAGIRGVVERNIAAYSRFATEVHDVFESGDRVVVRITHRATGAGVFRSRIGDHDVEGKQVTWSAIAIFRMQDGKISEEWVNRDELGILLSAGVLETGQSPTSIVGTWRLVKYEDQGADGTISYPYGEHPDGYFVYDVTDHLSVHIMRTPALKTFPGMREGTGDVARYREAFLAYAAYFGTYTVDATNGTVTHHVEGSLRPDYTGTDQVRPFRIEGDRLIIEIRQGQRYLRRELTRVK